MPVITQTINNIDNFSGVSTEIATFLQEQIQKIKGSVSAFTTVSVLPLSTTNGFINWTLMAWGDLTEQFLVLKLKSRRKKFLLISLADLST